MIRNLLTLSWWKRFLASQKLILILTSTTVLLAVWGFAAEGSFGDSVYNTMRLFNVDLDPSAYDELPWQLEAARFMAPVVLAYAFLVALASVLREQFQGFRVRRFYRRHVIVVGLGMEKSLIARHLRDQGEFRVVGIAFNETDTAVNGLRASGVPVVVGDPRDREVLRQASPQRAAHIIVSTGDDSTNLEVLAALTGVLSPRDMAAVHVVVDSPFLWMSLHRIQFDPSRRLRRIEFICIPDRVASLLVEAAESRGYEPGTAPAECVAVAGNGALTARLVVQLVRSPVFGGASEITVLLADQEEFREYENVLCETDPWALRRAGIRICVMERADGIYARPDTGVGFVVGMNEAETLEAVLRMRRQIGPEARIFAGVPDLDAAAVANEISSDFGATEFIPIGETVEGAHLMHGSARELIARGRHKIYVRERLAEGETVASNPSLVSWEQLPEPLKDSNRRYADGVAEILATLGADLVPLQAGTPDPLEISAELLDELAKMEHTRWCESLREDGWKYRDGPKDPLKKLHPLLVPWHELAEAERQKDRESVLALPELLAAVGYQLSPKLDRPSNPEREAVGASPTVR